MPAARYASAAVSITAPARLHLGFLDLNGSLERRFGSLGLALDEPAYQLHIRPAERLQIHGPDAARAERYVRRLHERLGWPLGVRIEIASAIPAHSGLGSGTQLGLACGMGMARLLNLPATPAQVAGVLGRGARSGIGIGSFEQGGFIIDGGRSEDADPDQVPPTIVRQALPSPWRVLLLFDRGRIGISGGAEVRAFQTLSAFTEAQAGQLCRLALMQVLPALAEADFQRFGRAISQIQQVMGDYFSPMQGGRFTSPQVAGILETLAQQGRVGLGQSSWGPTGFVLCPDPQDAHQLQAQLQQQWQHHPALTFVVATP
ncbi:MAG: GHMP kinase, partial [Thiothrix sp.]|nr:GHMP kinase [Thiothrix sp.]